MLNYSFGTESFIIVAWSLLEHCHDLNAIHVGLMDAAKTVTASMVSGFPERDTSKAQYQTQTPFAMHICVVMTLALLIHFMAV